MHSIWYFSVRNLDLSANLICAKTVKSPKALVFLILDSAGSVLSQPML